MKTMIALAALTASLGAMTPAANAQPMRPGQGTAQQDWSHRDSGPQEMRADNVKDRINTLQGRLNDGWRARQLNRREYSRLNSRLNRIAWEARRAERSGHRLDRDETMRLNAQLDDLSRDVFFQKHDGDRRG
ncbi:MAG: hypothetical protein ACXU8U_07395 [Asticcacaulis sp.]